MYTSLKVYPSGFMGSASVAQTSPIDLRALSRQLIQSGVVSQKSQYTANIAVVELDVEGSSSGSPTTRTFDHCERIITISVPAFGTEKLIDWLQAQIQSPEYGDNHHKFLDETFRFVFGGHRRTLPAAAWLPILTVGDNRLTSKMVPQAFIDYADQKAPLSEDIWHVTSKYNHRIHDITITDFIHCWLCQQSGIRDLQISINVLFGKR